MCCGHSHHKKHKKHEHKAPSKGAILAYYAYNCLHTAVHIAGVKGLYDEFKNQAEIIQEMQRQLIEVRKCLESARKIASLLKQHQQLANLISQSQELDSLFDLEHRQASQELKELLALLQSTTFEGDPSLFSRCGRTLRAYQLMAKVNQELLSKLQPIAVIDFSVSCAQLYLEYKDTQTPFCFTEYDAGNKPKIKLQKFWNPLFKNLAPDAPVIQAGQENPGICIITGPNKGGKSTALFSIAHAVVLGQTLTLSPATHCAITPFAKIHTGFCIHQRIEQGESLFSASLKLAHESLNDVESDGAGFSLIIMDEIFNSTDATRGSKIAYSYIRSLGQQDSMCIAFISTHFLEITSLEHEMPTAIKNYRVGKRSENTYFFESGIANKDDVFELIEADALNLKRN